MRTVELPGTSKPRCEHGALLENGCADCMHEQTLRDLITIGMLIADLAFVIVLIASYW